MRVLFAILACVGCYAATHIREAQFQIQGIEVTDEIASRERRQVNPDYVRPQFGRNALTTAARVQRVANGGNADPQATKYYYPPRQPLPLPKCFHNPTGYVCCNVHLNDLIVDTYTELESRPKFHSCNINLIARELQNASEKRFNTTFESIVSYDDFAQKVHFHNDFVCKVELGGRYMLAYATAKDVQQAQLEHDKGTFGPQNEIPRHAAKRSILI
ncbi:hypothetical protein L596_015493 [Steinernema carpocapsae]|uniref:Ground-like domain-containing protein n=1 Tax=Steinernema carpocapsae TaxID=34508 RepID=A0A4V6A347_STECR|nr:hypothetical protein L596_015493 [Steinernema carpocapsae]